MNVLQALQTQYIQKKPITGSPNTALFFLMVPNTVNGLAFTQTPLLHSPAPFFTFLSEFHPPYYFLVFSNSGKLESFFPFGCHCFFSQGLATSPLDTENSFRFLPEASHVSAFGPGTRISLDYRYKQITPSALNL